MQGLPTISIGSFRAGSQRTHDAVMAEFGGSLVDGNAEAEVSMEEMEPGVPAGMTEDGIELEKLEDFQLQPQDAEITDA